MDVLGILGFSQLAKALCISKSSRRSDRFLLLFTAFDALIESNCFADG
jgi:hypothetical protein